MSILGGNMNFKRFLYLGLFIAVLIVAACSPQATPEPTATPLPRIDTPVPAVTTEVLMPSIGGSGEVAMGLTEDGAPYRGNPDAPVTLLEYADFQ